MRQGGKCVCELQGQREGGVGSYQLITHSVDEKIIDANPQQEGPTDILVSEMLLPSISIPWRSKSVKQVSPQGQTSIYHLRDSI